MDRKKLDLVQAKSAESINRDKILGGTLTALKTLGSCRQGLQCLIGDTDCYRRNATKSEGPHCMLCSPEAPEGFQSILMIGN